MPISGRVSMVQVLKILGWLLSAAILVAVVALPVGTTSQLVIGVCLLFAMVAIWWLAPSSIQRPLMMSVGTILVLRYLYWRTFYTLPSVHDLADFIPGIVLLSAELFCIGMLFISLFVVVRPLERARAPQLSDEELPTVDIFIPTYNEEIGILMSTVAAAIGLDYPEHKRTVYLLDDGGTDQKCMDSDPAKAEEARDRRRKLQKLCAEMGATYLTRSRNLSAKAGNLNNGLQYSSGDLVVVFDADHAPTREFLRETVGHFVQDPKLFLVQTPHFFLNPDPIEKNLSTWHRMPSENEMFYSVIQRGLDYWNAAFFCGSAAVLRREALAQTGGFSGVSITEDCETALELHSSGWNSLYVDKPMIAGLQPETFTSFIGQRSRWCQGMMQILLMKNPLFKRGLSFAQRICYLSSALFWAFPFPRLVFLVAPLLYIFFDLKIFVANGQEFLAYAVTYLFANMIMQNYLFGKVRWPWVSELYEYIQSFYLAPAILSVVTNPKKPKFNVTEKGLTTERDFVSSLAGPYFVFFGILVLAMFYGCWRYFDQTVDKDLLIVVLIWNSANLVLAAGALGCVTEKSERRRTQRLEVRRSGSLELCGNHYPVDIFDASTEGAGLAFKESIATPPRFEGQALGNLTIYPIDDEKTPGNVPIIVRRSITSGARVGFGVQFCAMSVVHYKLIAELMYGRADPLSTFWTDRRYGKGILGGTAHFASMSTRQIRRALMIAWKDRMASHGTPAADEGPVIASSGAPAGAMVQVLEK
ncbi:cellulose synthase catalytic subunit (UDP-forming) [Roseibium sp. TrichSKD4]|nr:cellulose synthase catalytic subunit (UDP-forming) [Roseibium sp. TrichSKD4]